MKNLITLFIISIGAISFSQNKQMEWHNGSIETAMAKAEKLDAILFIYVYPENSSLTKEVNEIYFTPRPEGSWGSSLDVVDLYNENMVSVKMTAQAARRELGNTYDLSKPIFLWMNSINKKPIRGEIMSSNTLDTFDLENTSREILLNEFEKTGKSHPAYEFENFKNIQNKNNCDDIFCTYEILHRIFLKMPDNQKFLMYDKLSFNPGEIGSIELQWLMAEDTFINAKNEDRMEIFDNALEFSYFNNIPNSKNQSFDEFEEGYSKYANDDILKPLGKYAETFKQYLTANEEGKGFTNTVNSLLKNEKDSQPDTSDNGQKLQTIKFESGEISAEGNIDTKTGEKTGFWFNYNKEGKVIYTTTYTDNRNYTRSSYYPDGKPKSFMIYKNKMLWRIIESYNKDGKRTLIDGNGVYKEYYLNTMQLQLTSQMKNGVRDGVTNWYYKNGQLKESVIYKYSEDERYIGLRWEVLIIFDKEGNPLEKGTLKNGNGTWKKYDDEGKLSGTSTYKNGIEVD